MSADHLRIPIERLQAEFDCAVGKADGAALQTGEGISLEPWLREFLATPGAAQAVPSLNVTPAEALPDGAVVRFVGMVQDVHDPEYYDGVCEQVRDDGTVQLRTTMYQGCIAEPAGGPQVRARPDIVWQRAPIVCVPIPSRSAWVDDALAGPQGASASKPDADADGGRRCKRGMEGQGEVEGEEVEPMEEEVEDEAATNSKRSRAATASMPTGCAPCEADDLRTASGPTTGVHSDGEETAEKAWARAAARGVLLKVYESSAEGATALKVHQLVEVYGVLERPPAAYDDDDDDAVLMAAHPMAVESAAERKRRAPPSAQPRVHAIVTRPIPDVHAACMPSPVSAEAADDEAAALAATRAQLPAVRQAVMEGLTASLGGDALAAEFVLLSALSRILGRHGDAPIGKLHVNVTGCPAGEVTADGPGGAAACSPVAASLQAALSEVLPVCALQSLTIRMLNTTPLAPKKDHEANCLWPAALQLPAGALLLLDEARLEPGQLGERGVANVRSLTAVLDTQTVPYDFTYFTVDFAVDASVVSLSAAKSMLPIGCQVPLRVAPTGAPPPTAAWATAEGRAAIRRYIGLASGAQRANLPISPELSRLAQDEFVAARQADASVSADDFARLLTLSRLVAASALAPAVEHEHYEHAKQLDAARIARVSSREVAV